MIKSLDEYRPGTFFLPGIYKEDLVKSHKKGFAVRIDAAQRKYI